MLPRPRLLCQEPRCTWQIQPRPEWHVRVFCTDLNLFLAYIFLFFHSSVDLVGNFAGLLACTVPSVIVHCNQNEAGHQTIKAPSMPCWGATGPWKHYLAFVPQDWWNWQIKWMKSVSVGSFQYKNQVNGEGFIAYLYFSLESRLIPAVLELGQVKLFWKSIRSRIWQLSHSCQTGVWEYFPSSLALK